MYSMKRNSTNPKTNSNDYMSTTDFALHYGYSPITISRWCNSGRIPAIKVGHQWRIPKNAIDALRDGTAADKGAKS